MRDRKTFGMAGWVLVLAFFAILIQPSLAAAAVEEQGTVDKALGDVAEFMADEEMEWFQKNLKDAKALLIVPNLLKAGFILGGSGGSGVSWFGTRKRETGASRPFTRLVP